MDTATEESVPAKNGPARIARFCTRAPVVVFLAVNALLFYLCFVLHFAIAVRLVYNANTIAMPLVFLGAAAAIQVASRKAPACRRACAASLFWAIAGVALVGLRVYATHIEPNRLQVREVTIASAKITHPYTLLHLSDIQSAAIGPYERKVFQKIRELKPDLLLQTGDALQPVAPHTFASELPKLAALFRTLEVPLGMYDVEGDTTRPIYDATPEDTGGVTLLRSGGAEIETGGTRIRIFGLTLQHSTYKGSPGIRTRLEKWINADPGAVNIVLGHRPDYILRLSDLPADLCLAGHTHGGQIRIPFFGAPITFSEIPRAWARGFREVGITRLNVSAGVGADHAGGLPSIRINCPPEMTLIRFVPATAPLPPP